MPRQRRRTRSARGSPREHRRRAVGVARRRRHRADPLPRPTPYREKWVISRVGHGGAADHRPRRSPDASGNLPVISGDGATTRAPARLHQRVARRDQDRHARARRRPCAAVHRDREPRDLRTRTARLHVHRRRGAHRASRTPPTPRRSTSSAASTSRSAAATCTTPATASSSASSNGDTQDILVEQQLPSTTTATSAAPSSTTTTRPRSASCSSTTASGRSAPAADGNNLKDRSIGTVVRYNWIESGNRQLDLVDAEDDPSVITDPRYRDDATSTATC